MEQGQGARRRSEATQFEETRAGGRWTREGCHGLAWFVTPPSIGVVVEDLSPSKS